MQAEVVIVGGGHAGCEAALAAARLGVKTLLITMNPDNLGHMACNPAIGGIAKGQLVREIDALGGMMARAADHNAIQFRMLNSSKGPAVQSPRAQIDRWAYAAWVKRYLESRKNLQILQDRVTELLVENNIIKGVRTALGFAIACQGAVVCSGTFARARLVMAEQSWQGGRIGEPAANELSESMLKLGLPLFRLRTDTCTGLTREQWIFQN